VEAFDYLKCAPIESLIELQVLKRVVVWSLQQGVLKDRLALRLGKRVPAVQAELLTRATARAKLNDRVLGRAFLASEAQHIRHPLNSYPESILTLIFGTFVTTGRLDLNVPR
jgi:hypothetical protein